VFPTSQKDRETTITHYYYRS